MILLQLQTELDLWRLNLKQWKKLRTKSWTNNCWKNKHSWEIKTLLSAVLKNMMNNEHHSCKVLIILQFTVKHSSWQQTWWSNQFWQILMWKNASMSLNLMMSQSRRQWVQKTTSTEDNKNDRCICSLLIMWLFFDCESEISHTNPNCTCCKSCVTNDNKWCYIVQSIRAFTNWNATLYFSSSLQQWNIQQRKIYCKY